MRLALALAACLAASAHAQTLAYADADLRDVIADVEARTDWRFLYADALVAGKQVRARAEADGLPDALAQALAPQGVGVEADPARRRILLVPAPAAPRPAATSAPEAARPKRIVRGRVVDAETGEPLPFATVSWDGGRRGVVTDEAGAFVLTLRAEAATGRTPLTASYVGYRPQTASVAGTAATFRLRPEAVTPAAGVVVDALALGAGLDTAWAARLQPGRTDPLAEGGGLRALEAHPAVAVQPLFSEGLVVRGSPSDAFEVRLDGVPIYNPRHLFGLVDAFNGDALRAVALHVGVAPARYAVAPGGAVEYVTATGSPRRPVVQAGASSFAARASASVPLRPGRTTALAGGRASLVGATPSTGDLVEQGLGIARRTSPLPQGATELISRVLEVERADARFWDLHAAVADERARGGRTVLTAYAGGDEAEVDALRFVVRPDAADRDRIVRAPDATRNRWGSAAASLVDQRPLSDRLVLTSTLGGSVYDARFGRSLFPFQFATDVANPLTQRVDTLGYDNRLGEAVAAQRLDGVLGGGVGAVGYSLHLYDVRYEETAADRETFVGEQAAARLDLHAGWDGRLLPALDVDAGLRVHLGTGGWGRVSPRLRARLGVAPGLAVSAAAGRSVQVLHRLTLGDVVGAAAWVLSDRPETVTEADLVEAGVEVGGPATLAVTAYGKRTRALWLHSEDRSVRRVTNSLLARPWLSDVEGEARGVEALMRVPLGTWSLGLSGALARADLRHPSLNDGAAFPAAWDRRRRATLLADGPLFSGVRLGAAWTVASGAPNALTGDAEAERLPAISRLDLRLGAARDLGPAALTVALAVRNVLDADNAVDRERTVVLRETDQGQRRLGAVPLDVYDAGVLPTVDLALRF